MPDERLLETVTLSQAKTLVKAMAARQSLLLLSPPGVGKSDIVRQAAEEAGLPCRSLLGTQIAPEDVSGVPRIIGERSVFCPPRILLPEDPKPFCLFLDELPACSPDIQKAFYALLLERRLGEHPLPPGTWVVAAGNRQSDRALVRQISSALVNRVVILHVRVDFGEWLAWARQNRIRADVMRFLLLMPEALNRPVPDEPAPFSTPRSWASLGQALDKAERAGVLTRELQRALAFGRVSAIDAAAFCTMAEAATAIPDGPIVPNLALDELGLSKRTQDWLMGAGHATLRELITCKEADLPEPPGPDEPLLDELKSKLAAMGLSLDITPADVDMQVGLLRMAARQQEQNPTTVEVTLGHAKTLIGALADEQSLLLLSAPGVGKSDIVRQAAEEAKLPCRSLLGTQIAPEDVSGVPRIVGERSVFCPPRALLPEKPEAFCLFLDELPACSPDIQKAFYALLLERRLGEHALPAGTWVVSAGNRASDRALVRALSSALVNRVFLIHIRADFTEWREWAIRNGVREDVIHFLTAIPEALMRPVPNEPIPFSTPRAWASLARALDRAEGASILTPQLRRVLAQGRVTGKDAAAYCAMHELNLLPKPELTPLADAPETPLADLKKVSARSQKLLHDAGICSVRELVTRTERQLLAIPKFGKVTLRKVQEALAEIGLTLRPPSKIASTPDGLRSALLTYANDPPGEAVTLGQAKALIQALADEHSLLLLSAPGVGKSAIVAQAAREAKLECRSLLGTQIAPEDVSGVPRIIGERSVFCPPRILLPEDPKPFCLFLDELPACSPDIQKAFYALLLERRLGEHPLPEGTWVVAAGNRAADRALVRSISSALVNRVFVVQVKVDAKEWLAWAEANDVRGDVRGFISIMPETLMRPVPSEPVPFSTPRAWAALAEALQLAEQAGVLDVPLRRAIAFGRVTADDAAIFCAMAEAKITGLRPIREYVFDPSLLPEDDTSRCFVLQRIKNQLVRGDLNDVPAEAFNGLLTSVSIEHRFLLVLDAVEQWGARGADPALLQTVLEFIK